MKEKKILISMIIILALGIAVVIIVKSLPADSNGSYETNEVNETNETYQEKPNTSYNGEIIPAPEGIIAFRCWCYSGKSDPGWSYSYINTVAIRNNTIHVFETYSGSTDDSGTTTEYEKEISDIEIDALKTLLNEGKWEQVYSTCSDMHYTGSKYEWYIYGDPFENVIMPDGTYRWAYYYDQLLNSDIVPERTLPDRSKYFEPDEEEE